MKPEDMAPVPSPCISLCDMGPDGLCKGCLRTIGEIAAWGASSEADKRAVWTRIHGRAQAAGAP